MRRRECRNRRGPLRQARGAADRLPQPCELQLGLRIGQQEAAERGQDEQARGDADPGGEVPIVEGEELACAHHCAPT